jgi:hypothetical protein
MPCHEQRELPNTIDEVIDRLDEVIEDAIAKESRLGCFAGLYNRVTIAVRDGFRDGAFDDGESMERLDVVFASRYIEAFDRFNSGEQPTDAWHIAFDAAQHVELSVLQHLFLSMNAHIHLDLGVASAETAAGVGIDSIERDFHQINDVSAALVPLVEEELGEIAHRYSTLQHISHGLDRKVFNFAMAHAREEAWQFAQQLLSVADPAHSEGLISHRDEATVSLGRLISRVGWVPRLSGGADRSGVADHIRILARGEYGLPASP